MGRKDPWSAGEVFAEIMQIAPDIAFTVDREEDPNFEWDGDGPDPREEGYVPYDVFVRARAIVKGTIIEGNSNLGGVYDEPGKPDMDIHGYLPQMLDDALDELLGQSPLSPLVLKEARAAQAFLKRVLKERYDAQASRRR